MRLLSMPSTYNESKRQLPYINLLQGNSDTISLTVKLNQKELNATNRTYVQYQTKIDQSFYINFVNSGSVKFFEK